MEDFDRINRSVPIESLSESIVSHAIHIEKLEMQTSQPTVYITHVRNVSLELQDKIMYTNIRCCETNDVLPSHSVASRRVGSINIVKTLILFEK